MTRGHVDVPGGRLLVVDEGTGPPIALLHAGIADLRSWDVLAPLLVAAEYRVIRYDARDDPDRGSRHAELGPVTLRELLDEWAAHDLMHLVQAERAVMQPFLPD